MNEQQNLGEKMKLLITSFLFIFSMGAFAQNMFVNVNQSDAEVVISVKTEVKNRICRLKVTSLDITKPTRSKEGVIDVSFGLNPRALCLAARGPNSGQLILAKGNMADELEGGKAYTLIVNGETQDEQIIVE
jgi:hypothetical protein